MKKLKSVKQCPKCKSTDIIMQAGGHTGNYQCKKCGYIGPLIIEKDIQWQKKKNQK